MRKGALRRSAVSAVRVEVPAAVLYPVTMLARRRAYPIFEAGVLRGLPLTELVRDVYIQGCADGYEVAARERADAEKVFVDFMREESDV